MVCTLYTNIYLYALVNGGEESPSIAGGSPPLETKVAKSDPVPGYLDDLELVDPTASQGEVQE